LKSSGAPWWHPQRIPHFSPLWADDDDDDDDDELWRPGPLIDNDFPNEIHPDEPTVPTDEQIQYLSNIPKLKGSEYNCDGTTETTF
jgi:hypothetical protein